VSFFFTFPIFYNIFHSYSGNLLSFAWKRFVPYLLIPIQIFLICLPYLMYTWVWGQLVEVLPADRIT
jgi:hypothetical protein